jgi:iron complex transport system permease protein
MTRFSGRQFVLTILAATAFWAVAAAVCLLAGSKGFGWPETGYAVRFRAQSLLLASLIGAALAVAGVAYQAILKNPLADPYLLGVSSGASLAAYLWQLPAGVGLGAVAAGFSQQAFALVGALAAVAVVFTLATRRGRLEPVTLLLVGVIVNAVNGSIFIFVNALRPELARGNPFAFLVGGIQTNYDSGQVAVAAAACALLFVLLLWLAPQLNVAGLTEAEAQSLGVRIQRLRWVALLAVADALSRVMIQKLGTWPPVGVLTGLLGGPFFLYLLYRQRHGALEVEGP